MFFKKQISSVFKIETNKVTVKSTILCKTSSYYDKYTTGVFLDFVYYVRVYHEDPTIKLTSFKSIWTFILKKNVKYFEPTLTFNSTTTLTSNTY